MRKIAGIALVMIGISLPLQWMFLGNNFVSGTNTVLFIYWVLRYRGYFK